MGAKTFVVTGAGKPGIGDTVARRLLRQGHSVIGTFESDNESIAEQLKKDFPDNIQTFCFDHSSRVSAETFVNSIGNITIDGIAHCHFCFEMESPSDMDFDLWDKVLASNLSVPNFLTLSLRSKMSQPSAVVFVTSTEGFVGSFGASAYACSKAAIHNLVKTIANNFGSSNIRVNALAAGWIGGVMDTDEVFNMSRKITPLGRLGDPKEVASAVEWLLSESSSFVNGTVIVADGGYLGVDTISKYEFEQEQVGESN